MMDIHIDSKPISSRPSIHVATFTPNVIAKKAILFGKRVGVGVEEEIKVRKHRKSNCGYEKCNSSWAV
jgi:hypothetical protein